MHCLNVLCVIVISTVSRGALCMCESVARVLFTWSEVFETL